MPPGGLPLGDELLALVLSRLPPGDLAAAESACQHWRGVVTEHRLWRRHAMEASGALAAARRQRQQQQPLQQQQEQPAAAAAQQQAWPPDADKHAFLEAKWRLVLSATASYVRAVRADRSAHRGAVTSLSALPGAGLLASASLDGTLCLWALPQAGCGAAALRTRLLARAEHPAPVLHAALLNPELAASVTTASVHVWRIEAAAAGAARHGTPAQLHPLRRVAVGGRALCAAAWDMFVAVGCADGAVRVYDLLSGACAQILRLHSQGVTALQVVQAAGGDLLVSGGGDRRILITDLASCLTLSEAALPRGAASCLLLDPDSGRLLAGGSGADLTHHQWSAGRRLGALPSPEQRARMASCKRLTAAPPVPRSRLLGAGFTALALPTYGSGALFLAGDRAGCVNACDAQSGEVLLAFRPPVQRGGMRGDRAASAAAAPAGAAALPTPAAPAVTAAHAAAAAPGAAGGGSGTPRCGSSVGAPASQPAPAAGSQEARWGQRCTAVCGTTMPLVAGFADGTLCFWRWHRMRQQPPAAAAAAVQAGGAGAAPAAAPLPAGAAAGAVTTAARRGRPP